jgi:hypothetical protein
MRPYNSSKSVDGSLTEESDNGMMLAEQAAKEAQAAIDDANKMMAEITDENGTINVGLFKKASSAGTAQKGLLDPLTNKIRAVFDQVYAKVLVVKISFAKAKQALNDALAKIDQSNPVNQAQIAMIMANLAKIDQLEAKFSESMHQLASKLDLAIAGLDSIITGVTTWLPGWGSLIGMALDMLVMGDIKAFILELKAKLMAL